MDSPPEQTTDEKRQFLAALPDGAIHQLMVCEWLKCFQRNPDFKAYCDAKRGGDAEMCTALEHQHERIAELYDDWGDIHILPSMADADSFSEWYESKVHLFPFAEAELVEGLDVLSYLEPSNSVLVSIPKGFKKEQLLGVLADFVELHPELLGNDPKYELSKVKGELQIDTWKRIRRAEPAYLLVTGMGHVAPSIKKNLPSKAAKAIINSPSANRTLDFNWFIHGEVQQKLFEQDKLPSDYLKSYTRTINNLNKFYADCIEGTIRGTFPATTKA